MFLESIFLVGAALILWFRFTLPVVIFRVLKNIGYKKGLWPENSDYWSREEWSNWVWTHLNPGTAYMLNCPGCFGTRLSVAVTFLLLWLRPEPMVDPKEILLFLLRTASVSLVGGLFLLELLQRLSSPAAPGAPSQPEIETSAPPSPAGPPNENPEAWRAKLLERGVKATNSSGQEITRLNNRDYAVASFFAEIEQGRTPCDRIKFPGCEFLVSRYKAALQAAGGSSCPPCKQGELRRSFWEEVYNSIPVPVNATTPPTDAQTRTS